MKNGKKWTAILMALLLALGAVSALADCGGMTCKDSKMDDKAMCGEDCMCMDGKSCVKDGMCGEDCMCMDG